MKKIIKKLILPLIEVVAAWMLIFFLRMGVDHYVVDAFTISGFLILLQGLSIFVANEGAFTAVTWGFGKIVDIFRSTPKQMLKYYEYVAVHRDREKTEIWPFLLVGGLFLLVGIIVILLS